MSKSERITILQHSHNLMTKTWTKDGIEPYQDGKHFKVIRKQVRNIEELSELLFKLEKHPKACVIRGEFIGLEKAHEKFPDMPSGLTVRKLDTFTDEARSWLCIDVDGFSPISTCPIDDPVGAIEEFITTLPSGFQGVSYHWKLSSSAGSPGTQDLLKCHLWFWLDDPRTSAELNAWSRAIDADIDPAIYRTVQPHYTANPVFRGVDDPIKQRSGFVQGFIDDRASVDMSGIEVRETGGVTRHDQLEQIKAADPIVAVLEDQDRIRGIGGHGQIYITCPFEDEHSGGGNTTSTAYYPAHTGGFKRGSFKCLHAHCEHRPQAEFKAAIGYDEFADEFDNLDTVDADSESVYADLVGDVPATTSEAVVKRRGIPENHHLFTDQANANRIAKKWGKRIMVSTGRWFVWDGKRWVDDEGEVYRYACKLSKMIGIEIEEWERKFEAEPPANDDEAEEREQFLRRFKRWASQSEMKATIEAAVHLAKKLLTVDERLLDSSPWHLNVNNGVVDLRTGELVPHDPAYMMTKLAPIDYNADAQAKLWIKTVEKVTLEDNKDGKPIAKFLQRWFGYCATASCREQVFVVHYGSGKNGKSTILDTVADVLGDYAATAAPSLMVSTGANDRHATEIADLFGRRMVTAHESGEGSLLREDFIKQATGGDKLKARYMRQDFFEFNPTHKLQLLTNHKPSVKGQDEGIWRRVLLVPYLARFGGQEEVDARRATHLRDTTIAENLKRELEGVLAWIVKGAVAWYRDGLNPPDTVLSASASYKSEQDRVAQFVDECCELVDDEEWAPVTGEFGGIYPAYHQWCKDGGIHALSKQRLIDELERVVPNYRKEQVRKQVNGKRRKVLAIYGIRVNE